MKEFLTPKRVKAIKSWATAVAAVAVFTGVQLVTDLAPQYAAIIAALTAPAIKWADKNDADFGLTKK
jgi:energy-converting hydrogenase Eha subunit B